MAKGERWFVGGWRGGGTQHQAEGLVGQFSIMEVIQDLEQCSLGWEFP